jgi:hypothetical protein
VNVNPGGLRLDFDRRLKLEFHGSKVTSRRRLIQRRREQADGMSSSENHWRGASSRGRKDTSGAERTGVTDPGARQPHAAKVRACQDPSKGAVSAQQSGHLVNVGWMGS